MQYSSIQEFLKTAFTPKNDDLMKIATTLTGQRSSATPICSVFNYSQIFSWIRPFKGGKEGQEFNARKQQTKLQIHSNQLPWSRQRSMMMMMKSGRKWRKDVCS